MPCEIYTPQTVPLKRIEAIGNSAEECARQLKERGLDPAIFEFTIARDSVLTQPNWLQVASITVANGSALLSLGLVYGTSNNGNVLSQAVTMPKIGGGTLELTQTYKKPGKIKTPLLAII